MRRQQSRNLKQKKPQIKHVTFVQNVEISYLSLLASKGYDHLRRQCDKLFFSGLWGRRYFFVVIYKFLIPGLWNELIRQYFKYSFVVEYVLTTDIFVGHLILLQIGQGIGDILYQLFNILFREQLIRIESAFKQIFQSDLNILHEQWSVLGLNLDTVLEWNASQL